MIRKLVLAALAALASIAFAVPALAAPAVTEGDYAIKDFKFKDGESLPVLNIHYRTLGTPKRDAAGRVTNAVLILHGTGGTGAQFLSSPMSSSRPAAFWILRSTSSSCLMASVTADPPSLPTASG